MNQEQSNNPDIDDLSQILIDAFVKKHIISQNKDVNVFTLVSSLILIYKTISENKSVKYTSSELYEEPSGIDNILKNIKEIPCSSSNKPKRTESPFVHFDKMKDIFEFITQKYPDIHSIDLRDVFDIYANIKRIIEN